MSAPHLIAVMGPTASGKSSLAEALATQLDAVIINADAFQIYRGMDIGTAKPTCRDNYLLLDLKEPNEDFGVGEYVLLASKLLEDLYQKGRNVVICGGTGLYVRALLEEYKDLMPSPYPELRERIGRMTLEETIREIIFHEPDIASKIDLQNEIRVKRALEKKLDTRKPLEFSIPAFKKRKVAIVPTVESSEKKIKQRTKEMFQNGWVAEVNNLIDKGYGPGDPGFRALGYEAIAEYLRNGQDEGSLIQQIELDTVKYAKRQRTWLRAEPNLIVFTESSEALGAIVPLLSSND